MKFDIVTPSFNQVTYLPETIESVLSQEGPDVEVSYYIMDGGSTDGSVDIIRSHESKLAFWRSEQDEGQSAAIKEGLAIGDGEIIAWINSDDFYPPGVFKKVAEYFSAHPEVGVIYGDCLMVDEQSKPVGLGTHIPVSWQDLYETPYLINQESTFVRRRIYEKIGGVDPSYWGAMDYDLWLRIFYEAKPHYFSKILGAHRFLPEQKSSTSERYVKEMKRAREKFAKLHGLAVPPWPFSQAGMKRVKKKWAKRWNPVLKWVKQGCPENKFKDSVRNLWENYSQDGVLSVQGGTSFGWIGPEAIYIVDSKLVGSNIKWFFKNSSPELGSDKIVLDIEGRSRNIVVNNEVLLDLKLHGSKRFSWVKVISRSSFVPAEANWGPAYFSLSLVSHPLPNGRGLTSVQSIPCFPSVEHLKKQIPDKSGPNISLHKESVFPLIQTKYLKNKTINNRPLRIAFFTAYSAYEGSGCERLIYNTANSLIARGHDARVYVLNSTYNDNSTFFERQLPTLPFEKLFEKLSRRITGLNDIFFPSTAFLRLRRWISSADLWHFHNLHSHYLSLPLLGLTSWTKKVLISPVDEYISTGHCPYTLSCEQNMTGCGTCPRLDEAYPGISRDSTHALWLMKRLFFRFSNFNVLFHTKALAEHYENCFHRHWPYRIMHYGVDINCYRKLPRKECARRLGIKPNDLFVVGLLHSFTLDPRKGILQIVEKLSAIARRHPGKIGLLVVGHGSDAVRDVVPPELSVTVLPYLHHAYELANALNLCDVLLYPTQAENLSLTCLNALACGVPIISYDAGGQKEAIKDGVNGFVIDINDHEGMFKALLEMIENPDLCRRLSEGARHTAEIYFDFERYIDDLLSYYYEII